MSSKKYCDHLRQLIGENELEKVIQELSKLLKNSPKLDEAILQSSRWNDLKKQIRLGQIPYEQSDVSKNQIRAGLLELINSVEEKVAEPEIEEEVVQHLQTISGKNIMSNSTITAGGNVNIGDQIQHITESKTSRNVRVYLLVFVPLLAITTAVLYYRYQQLQKPLLLTVRLDNQTPNPELDKGFKEANLILSYGGKADTQSIVNETTFKGIPANYGKEAVSLKFTAEGFYTIDTTVVLNKEAFILPIRRDDTYARMMGIITDEDGNPLAGATVSIQNMAETTNAQGQFSLDIPFEKQRKQQRLSVTKAGFKPWDRFEPVFPNEIIRIQLEQN